MQGRYITHQALRALGAAERITMVTSFRAKSPFLPDDCNLATVRPISRISDLYFEFGEYRLDIMEARIRAQLANIREKHRAGKTFQTSEFKKFLKEQIAFLQHTDKEMWEEDQIEYGIIKEMNLPNADVGASPSEDGPANKKRPRVQ
jgi:hypothetical protein